MKAKVENFCMRKRSKQISVDVSEHACINCIWYEQHYRQNRGNVSMWIPISTGHCLLKDCERGPLRQPCDKFEREEVKL